MQEYSAPAITDLGSFAGLTLDRIEKNAGSGDVIVIAGIPPISVPGGGVIGVS